MYDEILSSRARVIGAIDRACLVFDGSNIGLFNVDSFFGAESTINFRSVGPKVAAIYPVPKDGSIARILFTVTNIVTTIGYPRLTARVETVLPAGAIAKYPRPSGTLWGVGTSASITLTTTGGKTVTLATAASVSANDLVAFVLSVPKGGVASGKTVVVRRGMTSHDAIYRGLPFPLYDVGFGSPED